MIKPETLNNQLRINPSMNEEKRLQSLGFRSIAGIDEAGRGPLAGPVVAGAAILPLEMEYKWLKLIRDSKQLNPTNRSIALNELQKFACVATGQSSPEEIDTHGIVKAVNLAMERALNNLGRNADDDQILANVQGLILDSARSFVSKNSD